jgi:RNA polymerase-binding transcription factor DksA
MDELRSHFPSRLAELEARAGRIDAHRRALLPADSEEAAQQLQSDEVIEALQGSTAAELAALRTAIARIDEGTYGRCEVCGERIPKKRLAAIPLATRCVDHADE